MIGIKTITVAIAYTNQPAFICYLHCQQCNFLQQPNDLLFESPYKTESKNIFFKILGKYLPSYEGLEDK